MRDKIQIRIYNDETSEQYYLLTIDDSKVWIANQDGEGMGLSQAKLFDAIHAWFMENH